MKTNKTPSASINPDIRTRHRPNRVGAVQKGVAGQQCGSIHRDTRRLERGKGLLRYIDRA